MKCFLGCGTPKACQIANEEEKTNINKCWRDCRFDNLEGLQGTQQTDNELTPEEEKDIEDKVDREMAESQLDEDVDEVLKRVQREMDEEELEEDMATSDGKPNWGGKRRRKKTKSRRKKRRKSRKKRRKSRKKRRRRRRKSRK